MGVRTLSIMNEFYERSSKFAYLHFFTLPTIINIVLPRQEWFRIQFGADLACPYEATTCPRATLLRFSEVYITVVNTIDHCMVRRHTLCTLNPKIRSFKVIAWLLVFYAADSSRARAPFLHRLSHAQLFL